MKTPEDIKKALECCSKAEDFLDCMELVLDCPYVVRGEHDCMDRLARDALTYIQQLESQIADNGKKVPRWISVKERLPKDGQKVIAAFRDGEGVIVDQARYSNGEFDFANWAYVWHENITHWMPMPEPPKEEHND